MSDQASGSEPLDIYRGLWDGPGPPPEPRAFLAGRPDATPGQRLDVLLVDQHRRWEAGDPWPVDRYLAEFPELAADAESRLDLAYGEYLALCRHRKPPDPVAFAGRFPDVCNALLRQLEVDDLLRGKSGEPAPAPASASASAPEETVILAEPAAVDPAPLRIGNYELIEELGRGGMGTVHRAVQRDLEKPVAVKVLNREALAAPEIVGRFLAEGRAVARLKHPNIVDVHGIGRTDDGGYFLVMDLVEGPSLRGRLKAGVFTLGEAARVAIQVAEALDHAHKRGVIHRDVAPGNVLLAEGGRALVTDFGLSKRLDAGADGPSHSDQIIGTYGYMAPEQAEARAVDARTDVYGLGGVLYALLTGGPPWPGPSMLAFLRQLGTPDPPRSPREHRPEVPADLAAICLTCLRKDPRERFGSAAEVARALRDWQDAPRHPDPPPPRPKPKSRRRIAAIGAAVATCVLAGWLAFGRGPAPVDPAPAPAPAPIDDPKALPPIAPDEIAWRLYRRRGDQTPVLLTRVPGTLSNGDQIRVECELTRGAYPYLFWISSDGRVSRLYPDRLRAPAPTPAPTRRVFYPVAAPNASKALRESPPGTDVALLIVGDRPLAAPDLAEAERLLGSTPRLEPLRPNQVLQDERPVGETARGFDDPKVRPLYDGPVPEALLALRGRLESRFPGVAVSTLALPHVAAP